MTKSELLKKVTHRVDLEIPNKEVEETCQVIIEIITDTLMEDGRIEIRGFGTLCLRERKQRTVKNLRTGEFINLESRKIPYFRPSVNLKSKVDASKDEVAISSD